MALPIQWIAFATTRVLTQTLSNLVTGNQELLDQFWSDHMDFPEEQSILVYSNKFVACAHVADLFLTMTAVF